ncbi:putative phage tail assembly chaperone [Spartinivicinus ruber]|uniref:putative phage tail assembly chaperone n=1 Tax=Spartinivicinus ruber TaxID=2683272 RepID=UPI0013D878B8|nr:putative phage tail assembly chaperone [Spartinivicinus ruber]
MSNQTFTLTIGEQDLTFTITLDEYNRFVNGVSHKNKVAMAYNFCMQTVVADDKDRLRQLLKQPAAEIQIATALMEAYVPELNIVVKPVVTTATT